jgi:hypothetical protein
MRLRPAVCVAVFFAYLLSCSIPTPSVAAQKLVPPIVPAGDRGALIERVTIDTFGVTKPAIVRHYLSLHAGSRLTQAGVNRDYTNLVDLAGYRPRVEFLPGNAVRTVVLRWIVMSKWLKPTSHPFYGDTPLSAPIQGVGFILTAPPLDDRGTNFSAYTQLSRRANLGRLLFTQPIHFNADGGSSSSLIVDGFGGRGVFRASEPKAINVYSWSLGAEALVLHQLTNGMQFEYGLRDTRSTDELSSNLVAPSLYNTSEHPARNMQLLAGLSRACLVPPYDWRPPSCSLQYRFQITDAVGGLGSTTEYHIFSADTVKYFDAGPSTVALHASFARSGGVLPDSFLVCATVRGYPKPFCGTDAQGATLEYRIDEAKHPKLEFVLFTEEAASRVRGAQAFALPYFTWHPDSGVGVIFRGFRLDLANGQAGNRLTFELQGQLF